MEERLALPTSLVALIWILLISSRRESAAPAQIWEQYSIWVQSARTTNCHRIFFFLLKERLEKNAGWQLGCQVILNSLIKKSLVKDLEVSQ